jgi:hypothetical protein
MMTSKNEGSGVQKHERCDENGKVMDSTAEMVR